VKDLPQEAQKAQKVLLVFFELLCLFVANNL
jgi:hypothetical protein